MPHYHWWADMITNLVLHGGSKCHIKCQHYLLNLPELVITKVLHLCDNWTIPQPYFHPKAGQTRLKVRIIRFQIFSTWWSTAGGTLFLSKGLAPAPLTSSAWPSSWRIDLAFLVRAPQIPSVLMMLSERFADACCGMLADSCKIYREQINTWNT